MSSDKEIVEAVCAGDRTAFAVLVARYERAVLSLAVAIVRDFSLADDVAQDAFVLAFEKLSSLTNRAAFGPWILKIARRRAYRVLREKTRHQSLEPGIEPRLNASDGKLDERLETLLQA